MNYLVTWQINIDDADDPEQAAALALFIMRDSDQANTAVVFDVTDKATDKVTRVDLS